MARYRLPVKTKQTLSLPLSLGAALLAGLSFVFALAPYGIWGVALLSPLIFYALLIAKLKPAQGFLIGLAYGFGLWVTGAFWLYTSIHEYGQVSSIMALLMIGAMALIMGLFHAVIAWVFVRFLGRQPLAFASLWVIQEWAKTWVLTGFPWLFVGYAYTDVPIMYAFAPWVGVLGISFVSVLISASIVEFWRARAGYLLIAGSLLGLGGLLALMRPAYTTPTGKTLSVALVQGNINQGIKWQEDFKEQIMMHHASLSQEAWGQDMVVWSEASITMFQDEAASFLQALDTKARSAGSAFLTGIPYKDTSHFDPFTEPYPPFYNSVMALGQGSGVYKKQRLVPFGEYIPFRGLFNLLPNLANNHEVANHSRGAANQAPLQIKTHPVGVAICYEVAYPSTVHQNAQNTELLLTVSNDAWFGKSVGPHQHLQMVRMRSLETGRYFVRATNTGITAIIDDQGRIVKTLPQFVAGVLYGEVPLMQGKTPLMRFGQLPLLGLLFVVVGLSAWAGRSRQYFAKDARFEADYR